MANCKKGVIIANDEQVRRSYTAVINSSEGLRCTFVIKNDLQGNWRNAKADKAYFGIVPVVGATERYDLAMTQFDLLIENVPSFPKGDEVEFFTPQDDLHKVAREKFTDGITLSAWLNAIVAAFEGGATLKALNYAARTKNGGTWQAAILGAEKV